MPFGFETQATIPGNETATFRSADGDTTVALTNAGRRSISLRELQASYGAYRADDVVWTLGVADMQGQTPSPGCRIEDPENGGGPFTILTAPYSSLAKFWPCIARNLTIAANLAQRCTFERPTWATGPGASRVPTWDVLPDSVEMACRFQTASGEPYEALAKRGERISGTVFLESWPNATIEDRIKLTTADHTVLTLQIKAWRNVDRIDVLPEVDVEQVPV